MSTADIAIVGADVIVLAAMGFGWDLVRSRRVTAPGAGETVRPVPAPAAAPLAAPVPLAPVPPLEGQPERDGAGVTAAFAASLKTLRLQEQLTTRGLGDMAGLNSATVSNAENGKTVTLATAVLLARALGVTVDDMAGGGRQEAAG